MTCCLRTHNEVSRCTRELAFSVAGGERACRQALKAWSIFGMTVSTREDHKDLWPAVLESLRSNSLISEEELDGMSGLVSEAPPAVEVSAPLAPLAPPVPAGNRGVLGKRDPAVPLDIHVELERMAVAGLIPATTLAQRQRCMRTTAVVGVPESLALPKRLGYIHPNLPPPQGMLWRCQGGRWHLAPRGG